ncbi:MAG: hypothetical protein NMNS01_24820 [Nitrosomonas sp.]|nr:MAG: hypothetical protein NMNS01_24820 [Nitrosomonas sp.]
MNEKQQQAVLLLASGKTGEETAKALNITPKTISTWRADADFKAAVNLHLENVRMAHAERLRNLCGLALSTIENCLNDKDLPSKVRLSASFKVLELSKVAPTEPGLTNVRKLKEKDFYDSL